MRNGWFEFVSYVQAEPLMITMVNIIVIMIYLFLFRKQYNSIIDPFFLTVVTSAFAFSTGICTFFYDLYANNNLFLFFVLSELAFIFGSCFFTQRKSFLRKSHDYENSIECVKEPKFYTILYWNTIVVYIITSLLNIIVIGLPIFSVSPSSRLNYYSHSTGIFYTIYSSLMPATLMIATYFKSVRKGTIYSICFWLVLGLTIFLLIGSGSKSGILLILFILYFWREYLKHKTKDIERIKSLNKKVFFILCVGIISCFFLIMLDVGEDVELIIDNFIFRIIGYGDIFPYFYSFNFFPNNIDVADNFIISLFGPFFQTLHIIPYYDSSVPPSIGLQVYQFINNTFAIRGPNPRHNVYGLVIFGEIGSIIYSLAIGLISSYLRNVKIFFGYKNIISYIFYIYLYIFACGLNTDVVLSINGLFISLLVFGIIIVMSGFILYINNKVFK